MPSEQPNITQEDIEDSYAHTNEIISDIRESQQTFYEFNLMLGDSMEDKDMQEKVVALTEKYDDALGSVIDRMQDKNEDLFRRLRAFHDLLVRQSQ